VIFFLIKRVKKKVKIIYPLALAMAIDPKQCSDNAVDLYPVSDFFVT